MLPPNSDLKRSNSISAPFSANLSYVQAPGGVPLEVYVCFVVSSNFVFFIFF